MAPGELSAPISWGLLLLVGRVGRLVNFPDFVAISGVVFRLCGLWVVGQGSAKMAGVLGVWGFPGVLPG